MAHYSLLILLQMASSVAPQSLAVATGATRGVFTAGLALLPLLAMPLRQVVGTWLPCAVTAFLAALCVPALQFVSATRAVPPSWRVANNVQS